MAKDYTDGVLKGHYQAIKALESAIKDVRLEGDSHTAFLVNVALDELYKKVVDKLI